eukprot:GEZU01001817.1.p1 GENE.GEZU01001817.1~~GEZU01001817.1.p1  ORF type:complete len:134 (-),score=37.21 GEZU01001817.1:266-667(-)
MVAPLGKIIVQIGYMAAGIVGKSVADAYRQAASANKMHKTAAEAIRKTVIGVTKMKYDEAQKILGVSKDTPKEIIEERFRKLFEANDPAKGGSFYLQSKIFRAKECLDKGPQGEEEAAEATTGKQQQQDVDGR